MTSEIVSISSMYVDCGERRISEPLFTKKPRQRGGRSHVDIHQVPMLRFSSARMRSSRRVGPSLTMGTRCRGLVGMQLAFILIKNTVHSIKALVQHFHIHRFIYYHMSSERITEARSRVFLLYVHRRVRINLQVGYFHH
jgi:hypothetical protein